MKLQINLLTRFLEVRSTIEVKKPLQKKKDPTKPKPKSSLSQTITIINHK